MNQIRFLEKQLSKYEKVESFDINNPQTYKKIENESTKSTTATTINNFFIGEEEEKNQKVIKRIGEGATSIAYKVIDKGRREVMCKKVVKLVDDEHLFKKLQNSMKEFEALLCINIQAIVVRLESIHKKKFQNPQKKTKKEKKKMLMKKKMKMEKKMKIQRKRINEKCSTRTFTYE